MKEEELAGACGAQLLANFHAKAQRRIDVKEEEN
jgi:hypothetical protein